MSSSLLPRLSRLFVVATFASLAFLAAPSRLDAVLSIGTQQPGSITLPRQYAPGSNLTLRETGGASSGAYQWFHDDAPIAGANSTTFTLTNLQASDSGNYHLERTVGSTTESSPLVTINVLPFPPSPADLTFSANLPSTSTSYPVVLSTFADGSMLVRLPDQTSTPPIWRLNPDGSRDTGFTFPVSAGTVIATFPDKSVVTSLPPYRLNPDGTPRALPLPAGFDSTKALTAAAVQPNGKLVIGQGNLAARLNADDTVDSSFSYAPSLSSRHIVNAFKFDATGRIFLSATEQDSNPSNFPQFWPVLIRLSAAGARDLAFPPQTPPLLRGGIAVYPLSDGRILRYSSYEGIVYWAILADDGAVDPNWTGSGFGIPDNLVVDPVNLRIFSQDYRGIRRWLIGATSLAADPTFYSGGSYSSALQVDQSGRLLVSGSFTEWDGHPTKYLVRLRPDDVVTTFPPNALIGANTSAPPQGSTLTFTSGVTGTGPFTYEWIALDHQPLPADTTSSTLVIPNFGLQNLGRYQLRVTSPVGTVLSNYAETILGTSQMQLPFLANLSGRAYVGPGDDTAIAGLAVKIYAGALGLPTLLRGAGPALQDYGVVGYLPNPVINLYNSTNQLIGNNDNWGGAAALKTAADASGAFPFLAHSNDAASLNVFGTSNTTIQLSDQSGGPGVGLLEIYRLASNVPGEILNLSFRAKT
ncbi:MAG: Ig family protein, partial [Lacunisphaera sp.]|nr:Ig family protein [Lacunisphaera sp.]